MRGLSSLLLLGLLAAPVQGQTCAKVPPPFLPGLFPENVAGMALQFATDPTGGCTGMYRPAAEGARQAQPWAVVAIDTNRDEKLGADAEAFVARFRPPTYTIVTMGGWPVSQRQAPLGDEFVAVKGSVRVLVLVKNGDQGEASQRLAAALMEKILPLIPCG